MTWHAGQDLQRLERKSVFIYLFICHGAVPCSTTPAIHQRHILCGFAQERMSHSSGSKSLQVYEKRDNRQMSSKTWQKIWSAALKITDLRKCLFWKTTCQSGTCPLASKLRYAINSIKSKQNEYTEDLFHSDNQNVSALLLCLELKFVKTGISCRIFQFCRKLLF